MDHASIAAKRYKEFKKEKRKESMKKSLISFLIKLFEVVVKALQKVGIIKKRKVETITVE
jgi:hypothetical protein